VTLKIEQLLVQYLYANKQVSLQGIGVFRLKPDIILPAESDKDYAVPADAFSFEYNLKATEDEGLINYIVEQTRKIKPLASSDLDSYAMLAKQFLNIGRPLVIEGIGTVEKNQQGKYGFVAGHYILPKIVDSPIQIRERKEEDISFETEHSVNNSGRNFKIGLTTVVIILAGLTLYYFLVYKPQTQSQNFEPSVTTADTINNANTVNPLTDTAGNRNNSIDNAVSTAQRPIKIIYDSGFKVVLKDYRSSRSVQAAYDRLTSYGHKLEIIEIDSQRYQLALPFKRPLSDTVRVRDSIKLFFGGRPYIKL
jgi:hypothetical protein